jgi:hypothetical protein
MGVCTRTTPLLDRLVGFAAGLALASGFDGQLLRPTALRQKVLFMEQNVLKYALPRYSILTENRVRLGRRCLEQWARDARMHVMTHSLFVTW